MTRRLRALLTLVATLTLVPTTLSATNPFKDIEISGTPAAGGSFKGMLSVERFERADEGITATVSITGTLVDGNGVTQQLTGEMMAVPVTIASTSCDAANIELASITLNVRGAGVVLSSMLLQVSKDSQTEEGIARLLCQISKAATAPTADSPLASRLNRLLDEIQ
jgi:hypothetical protein